MKAYVGRAAASRATAGRAAASRAAASRAAAGRAAAADSDAGRTAGEVALGGHDLVVVGAQGEASRLPGVEVVRHVDGAASALVDTDRPVLVEGAGTLNGRLVDTLGPVDVVDRAVGGDAAELGGAGRGIIGAEVLNDVVFDERALGPAVDGKVRVAVGAVGTAIVDGAERMLVKSMMDAMRVWSATYRAAPVLQPLPPTQLPLPDHCELYWPPAPLVNLTLPAPSVQKE